MGAPLWVATFLGVQHFPSFQLTAPRSLSSSRSRAYPHSFHSRLSGLLIQSKTMFPSRKSVFRQKHSLYIAANSFRGVRSIDHIFPLRFRWGFRLPSQQCGTLFQRVNVLFFCDSRESPADILSFCSPVPPSSIDRNLSTTFRLDRYTRRYPDYRTRVRFFAPCRFLYVSL